MPPSPIKPYFYKIDFSRDIVVQGKSSTYITITRNDGLASHQILPTEDLIIVLYPQADTFETHFLQLPITGSSSSTVIEFDISLAVPPISNNNEPAFNKLSAGLTIKDFREWGYTTPPNILNVVFTSPTTGSITLDAAIPTPPVFPYNVDLGTFSQTDGADWKINTVDSDLSADLIDTPAMSSYAQSTVIDNPFDGTTFDITTPGSLGTGYIQRNSITRWIRVPHNSIIIPPNGGNVQTRGVTIRLDYLGNNDSHLKLNMLIAKLPAPASEANLQTLLTSLMNSGGFGIKTSGSTDRSSADYQELHLFGYPESYVRPSRVNNPMNYPIESPIYEDRSSFGLLKTNPKLSGNVKITTDSNGDIWLNSFSANEELSDAAYKKFSISSASTYQKDLWTFFKKGQTPTDVVFDVYQFDDQYVNNKTVYSQQFDNFYNYGVEQLSSKMYDEDLSFLAPLWLRKDVPEFFVIFRVDHPINESTYYDTVSNPDTFNKYFQNARIIKTFDLRDSSKLGSYIRKISSDPRFKERPLEVSWEKDTATYWYGASYQNGSLSSKGEFLYDFLTQDREIKEFEEYITDGFQRNGVISTNLLNLEFLFNDEEADLYSINRYFGMYVNENQLAEFEIEPTVLGKVVGQSPPPKKDVDGEPYSTRAFIQTNPEGIQIPVNYHHSTTFTNNTTNIPAYQGLVFGKFPLPAMVEDPLRIFYTKDRDDVFKRVIKISEVDYGYPGTDDYVRATQLELFDTQEDISKYAGVNEIVSQFQAELLPSGNSQLRVHLFDQKGTGVLADDEEILLQVKKYNDPGRYHTYHTQITATTATTVTLEYFIDQYVDINQNGGSFLQPALYNTSSPTTITVTDSSRFAINENVYMVNAGNYQIVGIPTPTSIQLINIGGSKNVAIGSPIGPGNLISSSLTGEQIYTFNPLNFETKIDNYLTLNLLSFGTYSVLDAWRIVVDYPDIQKFDITLGGSGNTIDAMYTTDYEQFTWRMLANGIGLQPSDAWDHPQYDPNGTDFLSQFSNEGTSTQVANALAKCINMFDNCPVNAWADGDVVYLKSSLLYEEGNSLQFTRKIRGNSVYANLGFYERGNADRKTKIDQVNLVGLSSLNVNLAVVDVPDTPTVTSYYYRIFRGAVNTTVFVRSNVNTSSYATVTTSGTPPFNTAIIPTTEERYVDYRLPFSIDMSKIPRNVIFEQCYTVSSTTDPIKQDFVGGEKRLRNRAEISYADGQKYYQDRRVSRTSTTIIGSSVITLDTSGLYIGAAVLGTGIPENTYITDVNNVNIVISKPATASGAVNLKLGELSILNDEIIYQQWYQSLKGTYSRMKGWEIQGKYVYSLPYLDEPAYDRDEYVNGFTDYLTRSIIQLEDADKEFYYSVDNRIVAYRVYRPIMGILSLYPLKQFDFDFFLSDYSYTPTLEAFKYFFKETFQSSTEPIELPVFQNFALTQTGSTSFTAGTFMIEAFDQISNEWYASDTINTTWTNPAIPLIINTFYPLYDYDVNEFPHIDSASVAGPQYVGPGKRNYDRRYMYINDSTNRSIKIYPTKFRIFWLSGGPGNELTITNHNYTEDNDLPTFNGFAGLQDITNMQDSDVIQQLKDEGKFIESFTYQLLLSEYDRLRENYNKEWALKSKVVPYITKWVQEGTDARDNYYRLNNSMAFGLSNMSPISSVEFSESSVLSQEFPYLDSVPQAYPVENLAGSRSYHFAKLSDVPAKEMSWYDLMLTDNNNDWFTKYFSIGYPTEKDPNEDLITRPREERFTFFNYIDGIGRSQALFRGGKIQPVVYNDNDPMNIIEISNSDLFKDYKFSAITRFDAFDLYKRQKPIEIEFVRNDKYKWVAMVITVRTQDYRTQSGGSEYMFQYFMDDILINSHQEQTKGSIDYLGTTTNSFSNLRSFTPYNTPPTIPGDLECILRPHQGFLGGGYLRLGDKKLGGVVVESIPLGSPTYTPSATLPQLFFKLNPSDINYSFNLLDEVLPISNRYRIDPTLFVDDSTINTENFGQDGFTFNFITTFANATSTLYKIKPYVDNQEKIDIFGTSQLTIGASRYLNQFLATAPLSSATSGTSSAQSPVTNLSPGSATAQETYHIEGGTSGFSNIKTYLTFGNLFKLVNSEDPIIEYYNVTDAGKISATNYKIRFIAADSIIKTNVLHYSVDEDKPAEYTNTEYVGYNVVDTQDQEYMVRHRGFYEPKTRDLISFWVREDNAFSDHYEKDFLLSNTRIETLSSNAGLVKNYGFNKVATSGNILQIARTSAYKSVYPLISEIPIDYNDYFSLESSWDNNFYRNYTTTTNFSKIEGIAEMKEERGFLASKAMIVPKSFELHTFDSNEVTFSLIEPNLAIGVDTLSGTGSARNQSGPEASKPKLVITCDLRARLLRELLEDIAKVTTIDEFERLQTIAPYTILETLTTSQIDKLKTSYFEKNIIDLYNVTQLSLYIKTQEGIDLVDLDLTEADKSSGGYKIDKDCVVKQTGNFTFEITKLLDTKIASGFSLATTLKRI